MKGMILIGLKKCRICDKKYSDQKNDKGVCPECLLEVSKEFLPNIEIHNKYMDRFLNGKLAVKCNTEYDLRRLIDYLNNKKINTERVWLRTHWKNYGNEMYFYIKNNDEYDYLYYHYNICCGYNFFKRINFKKLKL